MQSTKMPSVPEDNYTGSVASAATAREQLPLVPLPPANLTTVLSPFFGRPSGVVKPWDDGATWDGENFLPLLHPPPQLSLALFSWRSNLF
jgi:hypothetical protein